MSQVLAIDFESHYDKGSYSVKDLGNWLYCQDSRFRVLTVATHDGERSVACPPDKFPWDTLHDTVLLAHNAPFDRAVFSRLQELGQVPAGIVPRGWVCTASAAAYHGLPRDLAGACKYALGVEVDKTTRDDLGQGSLFARGAELEAYAAKDAELCWQLWQKLCPTWPVDEARLSCLTDDMGRRGVRLDVGGLAAAVADVQGTLASCRARIPFDPPMSTPAFRAWCDSVGAKPPASTSKTTVAAGDADPRVTPVVAALQEYRAANRTLTVLEAMRSRVGSDGRCRYQLKYFGAGQTGRWSGGGGLNMQNFNRGDAAGGIDMRGLIVPEPGHVFIVVDYAQIEARVLLWLARETSMLEWLRGGMDLYEAAARRMLGYADPRPIKQVNPALRQLAKAMALGLGFGMGAKKFVASAKVLGGVELTYPQAEDAVKRFRGGNANVVTLWDRLRDAFDARSGKRLYRLPLPSGRVLRYWDPVYDPKDDQRTAAQVAGGDRVFLHPGLLAENMVQATARDILAQAWLRCAAAGFAPVLSVHDELVFEVPEATAQDATREIERLMLTPPAWDYVDLLPLAVESKACKRYGK